MTTPAGLPVVSVCNDCGKEVLSYKEGGRPHYGFVEDKAGNKLSICYDCYFNRISEARS